MTTQQVPKWHHYVPQGYLRNFADNAGALHGYNKTRQQNFYPAKPRDVAAKRHFHTNPLLADPQELERRLHREFEAPLLGKINALLSNIRLTHLGFTPPLTTPETVRSLATFAALQLVRTNAVRVQMHEMAAQVRTPGVTYTDEELAKFSHLGLLDQHMADDFAWYGGTIARHRLTFLTTTRDQPFWTSDHPVTVAKGGKGEKALWGGIGLKEDHLELYLPLSWDVMVVFFGTHITQRVPPLIPVNAATVLERNRLTFANAHELVLSSSPVVPPP